MTQGKLDEITRKIQTNLLSNDKVQFTSDERNRMTKGLGFYGELTTNKVKEYDQKYGLRNDGGIADWQTRNKLIWGSTSEKGGSTKTASNVGGSRGAQVIKLQKGSSGAEVTELQKALESKKFFKLPDGAKYGYFGQATERAVKAFQTRNGLTVDGIVGKLTLEKLGIKVGSVSTGKAPAQVANLKTPAADFNELKAEMDNRKVEENTVFGGGNLVKLNNDIALTASHVLVEGDQEDSILSTFRISKAIKAKVKYQSADRSKDQIISYITIPAGTKKEGMQGIVDSFLKSQGVTQKFLNSKTQDKTENFIGSDGLIKRPYADDNSLRVFSEIAHPDKRAGTVYTISVDVNPYDLQLIEQKVIKDPIKITLGSLGEIGKVGSRVVTVGQDIALVGKPGLNGAILNQKAQELKSNYARFAREGHYKPLPTVIYTKGDGIDFEAKKGGKPRYVAGFIFPKPLNDGRRLFVPIPKGAKVPGMNFSIATTLDDYSGDKGNSGSFTVTKLSNGEKIYGAFSGGFTTSTNLTDYRGLRESDLEEIKKSLSALGYPKDYVQNFDLSDETGVSAIAFPGTEAEFKLK